MLRSLRFSLFWLIALMVSATAYAQESYQLGPGDRIQIKVYGQADLTTEAEVAPDGTVDMPLLGPVLVEGLPAREAAERIARGLQVGGYLKRAHVNVLITDYLSKEISVLGQVNKPGQIALTRPTSVTEAIAIAGGINTRGSERIFLTRKSKDGSIRKEVFQLRDLMGAEAGGRLNAMVQNGDTLYVPLAEKFYVHGQVRSPGTYELDRSLNVMQALSVGGGLGPKANSDGLIIYRKRADGSVQKIDAKLFDPILDGDVLFIKESFF